MENGAKKYEDRNWERGLPMSCFADSAIRHLEKAIAGYTDEDHWAAALWNVACAIETEYRIHAGLLPVELDDLPKTFAEKDPLF